MRYWQKSANQVCVTGVPVTVPLPRTCMLLTRTKVLALLVQKYLNLKSRLLQVPTARFTSETAARFVRSLPALLVPKYR